MKKIIISVFFIIVGLSIIGSIWLLIYRREVDFKEVCRIRRKISFRLSDNSFFEPEGWIWYSICENPDSGFDTREIDDYIQDNGIAIDMDKYTYIVVKGYVLESMYVRLINSIKLDDNIREWKGYVTLSPKCDPHDVVVYQISKQLIVPSSQYRNDEPFVHIIR